MAKTLKVQLQESKDENLKLREEMIKMKGRALKVHEQNELLTLAPDLAIRKATMEHQLSMAKQFVESKAFPKSMTPEQCFTIMKAGAEMGLKEVESLQTLYIVNGAVKPYGSGMVSMILKSGYKIEYLNENENGVDVRCYHPDPKEQFDITEKSRAGDPQLKNSESIKISKRNKLRFHGVRLVASFHLPHVFSAITDYGSEIFRASPPPKEIQNVDGKDYDAKQTTDQKNMLIDHIEKSMTIAQLEKASSHVDRYELREMYDSKKLEIMEQKSELIEEIEVINE